MYCNEIKNNESSIIFFVSSKNINKILNIYIFAAYLGAFGLFNQSQSRGIVPLPLQLAAI